jgi:hypothetical protein
MTSSRCRGALGALLVLGASPRAQDPPAEPSVEGPTGYQTAPSGLRFVAVDVPGATHVAVVAAVRVGAWHDPVGQTGLTLLLNALVGLTQEARPEPQRWSVRTTGPASIFAITCARDGLATHLGELARFLGGELSFADDLVARAKAQVLKQADDFLHYVPGPLLFETARRSVMQGTPAGKQMFGVPAELAAIDGDIMRAWFTARVRPEHTTLVVLGGVDVPAVAALIGETFAARGERTLSAAPTVHDGAGAIVLDQPHARVAAPFVTVAIRAPAVGTAEWLPFVIAMGVVEIACHRAFGAYRGREAEARFPFLWFDYRHGDAFALINRRGTAGAEGEFGRDVEGVRGEVHALIKRMRTVAPPLSDVGEAARAAALALAMPPYAGQLAAMAQHPGLLMPRAELLAMADILGLSPRLQTDVGHIPVHEVLRALANALADDNLTWLSLVPKE